MFNFSEGSSSFVMNSRGSGTTVTVNGKTVNIPSGSVSISNNKIFVNGKEYVSDDFKDVLTNQVVNITINGDCESVECNGKAEVKGNVSGNVSAGDSVRCGNVRGNVNAGDSVYMNK